MQIAPFVPLLAGFPIGLSLLLCILTSGTWCRNWVCCTISLTMCFLAALAAMLAPTEESTAFSALFITWCASGCIFIFLFLLHLQILMCLLQRDSWRIDGTEALLADIRQYFRTSLIMAVCVMALIGYKTYYLQQHWQKAQHILKSIESRTASMPSRRN